MTASVKAAPPAPKPVLSGKQTIPELITIRTFLLVPFLALAVAVPVFWGWGVSWLDLTIGGAFFVVSTLGVTVGYHRYFTHGSFRAKRALRIALAVAGGLAAQGPVIGWVADHRRHHAFSDREGDPHSPWLFGTSPVALARGFWHAHMGWLFGRDKTNVDRFAPDLAADRDLRVVDRLFPVWVVVSLLLPPLLGGLITLSWWGALTAFLWAGLARISFQHHVTWSVNSICHMIGERPFTSRDRSANFWPLAILSMGESWHNTHHADPTSARHGAQRGQIDISARVIWAFEKLGWAWNVRWPTAKRLAALAR
ncbi:stearoyl-CoA desaturase (delta-9 desaturase) [Amycolatopsis mediterranei S699]|uniref:Stearoyl-CoA desaturase (Delta-9 desaturase) n=2 Tax=Amycolatopsis mediterranei TaxID=33910 RepID=A0A0H3D6Q6_AMYMU|nr:acyl-CoA desaturase [Amycolatopsis mediterranei]ADJ46286.1 stearoyl-CoA desaturase (delta-9 desaturase) [Amycolatopsis mediterranei U32]AEK43079.1 stearoyl-CoA desaturase (delta-9 desaturase) [Amycolatopsis mediterranei S699]AFO77997.1 stearoyl-CoA desaturase (delta-9 desaturase) [Amycolatopsis mediterranei S699]AGT85125.1 stearoyl-CoA desaturase (delta-9 desaturase) [Amycolatopsis mediterranei RB]KDO05223.1 stearoyl-CoA 9-desaturase [Amycolatopsis mediterranei]